MVSKAPVVDDSSVSPVRRRVLIVDGDPQFGHSLEPDFRTRAFDVEMVSTSAEAIKRVATAPPDLVVLDLYLTEGAAPKLIRLWKAEAPAMAVVLVSGNASLTIVVDALKEGARGFFTKPVTAASILDDVREHRGALRPNRSSPPLTTGVGHELGTAALNDEGIDRFFSISPGLLSIAGFDGYLKMLNPAWEKTLGFSVDELCARPYLELVHPDDREKATDEALEIRGGHTVFHFKNRYLCKDGSYRWLAWSATPDPVQKLIYASARDVTKMVRMELGLRATNEQLNRKVTTGEVMLRQSREKHDALVELGQFKDEVGAMIAHDLKNPLTVIIANYDYIREGFEGSADCLEALEDSQNAARRMLRLLQNLVDVARIEDGKLTLNVARCQLSDFLAPIIEQRRVLARRMNVSIVVLPCHNIALIMDADLLARTIENILDNALRYVPALGKIEVSASQRGSEVEIRISNTGPPVPLAIRETVFDKNQQAEPVMGPLNLGLGLYFCRLAVGKHGGRIWVEETESFPAVFCLRLPCEPAMTGEQEHHRTSPEAG